MGAYTTVQITRSRALAEWAKQYGEPSDQQLEIFLDKLLEDQLYNTSIVPDDWDNDNHIL